MLAIDIFILLAGLFGVVISDGGFIGSFEAVMKEAESAELQIISVNILLSR